MNLVSNFTIAPGGSSLTSVPSYVKIRGSGAFGPWRSAAIRGMFPRLIEVLKAVLRARDKGFRGEAGVV